MGYLHEGHRERLRARFLREDLDGFEPHAVLELLLFYAIARTDTNIIAHRLLKQFGSLSGVLEAPYRALLEVEGVGPSAAALIKMIPSISRCYLSDKCDGGDRLDSPDKLGQFILPHFVGHNNELLYVICLDRRGKLLNYVQVGEGTLNAVSVDLRKIIEAALAVSASAVVLAHNHTQGFAIPSDSDCQVTKIVAKALEPFSVYVIDHIIVARDDFVSMAASGMIHH
ncbi:MAG: DNA repair protein RadC [Oscillospiraceae bacterium]